MVYRRWTTGTDEIVRKKYNKNKKEKKEMKEFRLDYTMAIDAGLGFGYDPYMGNYQFLRRNIITSIL